MHGILLAHFQLKDANVNAILYYEVLGNVHDVIYWKCPSYCPAASYSIMTMPNCIQSKWLGQRWRNCSRRVWNIHPIVWTSHPETSTFLVLWKHIWQANISANDAEVKWEGHLWLQQQLKEVYAAGLHGFMQSWDKCANIGGLCEKMNSGTK